MQIKLKIKHSLLTLALLYILIRTYFSNKDVGKVDPAKLTPDEARELERLGVLILLVFIVVGLLGIMFVLLGLQVLLWILSARGP